MMRVQVDVLGALKVSGPDLREPHLPRAIHRLIATIAAAGADGIGRNRVAVELWGDPPPESWKSALRNRVTAARRVLGSDAILNDGGWFRFGEHVAVDSWDLIDHGTNALGRDQGDLSFLDGEPFVDLAPSALLQSHARLIVDARVALVQRIVGSPKTLTPRALQSLRSYRRRHPLNASLARHAVKAHVRAGFAAQAGEVVDEVHEDTKRLGHAGFGWVDELDELLRTAPTPKTSSPPVGDASALAARAELFEAASADGNWSLALEIAMAGLPEAERSEGDPPRLALLEAIPLDMLAGRQKFSLALTMARHLMYAGREADARSWSRTTRALTETPDDELQSFIIAAILGETDDERRPIPLPPAFENAPLESVSMRSLQVAVVSHLERAPFVETAPLRARFQTLVEFCGKPYRRWHLLLLESMGCFVDGEIKEAAESARTAFRYAQLFGIGDAETALLGQLSNASWVHPGFDDIDNYEREFPAASQTTMGRAVQAVASVAADGSAAVDEFVRTFDHHSRTFFTFPLLALVAPHVSDPTIRAEMMSRLRERTGTSAIYGTGVLHLGPVDRVLARMIESDDEAKDHFAAAVAVADEQQTRLWQVICRLDLAALTGDSALRRQAQQLATTTDLEQLVTEYRRVR